jgi:hypothetical protein
LEAVGEKICGLRKKVSFILSFAMTVGLLSRTPQSCEGKGSHEMFTDFDFEFEDVIEFLFRMFATLVQSNNYVS